jgi:hypothetical protein
MGFKSIRMGISISLCCKVFTGTATSLVVSGLGGVTASCANKVKLPSRQVIQQINTFLMVALNSVF